MMTMMMMMKLSQDHGSGEEGGGPASEVKIDPTEKKPGGGRGGMELERMTGGVDAVA
jgi:hypothetical protein